MRNLRGCGKTHCDTRHVSGPDFSRAAKLLKIDTPLYRRQARNGVSAKRAPDCASVARGHSSLGLAAEPLDKVERSEKNVFLQTAKELFARPWRAPALFCCWASESKDVKRTNVWPASPYKNLLISLNLNELILHRLAAQLPPPPRYTEQGFMEHSTQ